jgi:UDP-N-acetylglucosamine 3-dehydrogenase
LISVAILGAGFMGGAHAVNYQRLGDRVRLHSVASRTLDRAAKVADACGALPTTDLEAAVADSRVDVVDICLPSPLHRIWTERALEAGKHVFLEKPIALTVEDADAIVDAAARHGRVLMVGLVLRFWPEYAELQRRVAAGELGRPRAVATYRLSPPIDWNDWMADPEQSGGVSVDLLVHDFDQMNWLLGNPRTVFAREPRPGHMQALVEYDGATGLAEGSVAMPRSYPFSSNIRAVCEHGAAEYAFSAAAVEGEGNIRASESPGGLRVIPGEGPPAVIPIDSVDPWGPELEYFVDCVERERQPEQGTADQARHALLVSLAANRSLESGMPEPVQSFPPPSEGP